MSRIGKLPVAVPSGVDVAVDEQLVTVKGPKGTLSHTVAAPITVEQRATARSRSSVPNDERESRSLHGLTRTLINNMVVGVTDGYEKKLEIVGVGYRVLSKGPTQLEFQLGYSPLDHVQRPRRASPSPSTARPGSESRASTSSSSARSPPTSASCASRSPTRARAFATRASTSAARSERLVSDDGDRTQDRQAHRGSRQVAPAAPDPRPQEGHRHRRASAPRGDPLLEAHHRAGRRRPGRQDARVGLDHGGRPPLPRGRQDRQGQARSASSSPSAPRRPVSTAWSSTAPATSTTAASRPLPTAPARAA